MARGRLARRGKLALLACRGVEASRPYWRVEASWPKQRRRRGGTRLKSSNPNTEGAELTVRCVGNWRKVYKSQKRTSRRGAYDLRRRVRLGRSARHWLARSGSRLARPACSINFSTLQRAVCLIWPTLWLEMACSIGFVKADWPDWLDLPANESPNA